MLPWFSHLVTSLLSKLNLRNLGSISIKPNLSLHNKAADHTRLEELKQDTRQYLAWKSIYDERVTLNLDEFQRNQALIKRDEAQKIIEARIPETYIWVLVPDQPDPKISDTLQEFKLQPQQQSSLASNVSRRLKMEGMFITQYAGTLLRSELDRIPLWRGNYVQIKELAENFAKYIYLPRLKSTDVLLVAIQDGIQSLVWERETFSYVDSWDATQNRYLGLRTGQQIQAMLNVNTVLVKSEVAVAQIAADAAVKQASILETSSGARSGSNPSVVREWPLDTNRGQGESVRQPIATPSPVPAQQQLHRFHRSTKLSERMMAKDAGIIMEEVVKHLTSLYGAKVHVTLEIQAEFPDGVPDTIVRTVMENCRTLKFESSSFEEE